METIEFDPIKISSSQQRIIKALKQELRIVQERLEAMQLENATTLQMLATSENERIALGLRLEILEAERVELTLRQPTIVAKKKPIPKIEVQNTEKQAGLPIREVFPLFCCSIM